VRLIQRRAGCSTSSCKCLDTIRWWAPAGCVLVAVKDARLVWTAALGPGFAPNPTYDTADDFYLTVDLTMTAEDGGCRYTVKAMHATLAAVQAHEKMGFFEGWGTTTDQLSALAEAQ